MDEAAAHSAFWAEKGKKGDKVFHLLALVTFILKGDEKSLRLLSANDEAQNFLRFMSLQLWDQSKPFDSDFCLFNTFVQLHFSRDARKFLSTFV